MLTRRTFLQSVALTAAAAPQAKTRKLAIIADEYSPRSHAQQMGDRFLLGYPHGGAWRRPAFKVASLHVARAPESDLSASRSGEFDIQTYPSPADALRCDAATVSVDAVLIGGSAGLVEQCAKVFEQDRRAVPVFHYPGLTGSFAASKAAVDASRRLKFPLMAGSFTPVTWRLPSIELPAGCDIESAVVAVGGFADSMAFHALEGLQCMVERRRGGESGVKSVQYLEGAAVWKSYSPELLTAALSRSDTPLGLTFTDGRTQDLVASGKLPELVKSPAAYVIEYQDGLKATVLLLDGAIKDFNFAAKLKGGAVWSTQFLATPDPNDTYANCLAAEAERMFETGVEPYPVERSLLVSGILAASSGPAQTGIRYKPPRESRFGG